MTHNPQSRPATLADFAPGNRIRIEAHIKQRYQNTINISDIQIIEHTPGEENYPDQLVLTARIDTVETWETIE